MILDLFSGCGGTTKVDCLRLVLVALLSSVFLWQTFQAFAKYLSKETTITTKVPWHLCRKIAL